MDLAVKKPPTSVVCEGCLTTDRRLKFFYEGEIKELYTQLLNASGRVNALVRLCWECAAVLHSVVQFRTQIQKAHYELYRLMINQNLQLKSLSKLKVQTNQQIITFEHREQNTDVTSLHADTHSCRDSKLDGVGADKDGSHTFGDDGNKIEPLAFIKIEEDDDFIDDEFVYADNDLKAVLKREKTQQSNESNIKNKEKEFDDSDDEPLVKKKKEKEEKPRKSRKKKEQSGRRERAPGVICNERVERQLRRLNVPRGQLEMVLLSWEEVVSERASQLTSASYLRHAHRCASCALGFNHKHKLDNHMKKHEMCEGGQPCSVCGIVCRTRAALIAHRRRHRLRWRCCTCFGRWSRACVAADHVTRAHTLAHVTHTCTHCGDTHATLSQLRVHQKSHSERQKCELCEKTFRDKTSLRTHMFIHKGEKEYQCPRCDKKFLFKKSMEIHLVTHEKHANLYCHECDMNFKNKMSYYQHMKYNLKHIDPAKLKYICSECGVRFSKASRLADHRAARHDKLNNHHCTHPHCGFSCASRGVLRSHIRSRHGDVTRRTHVCHQCGKTYTTKKSLEGHIRTHTGERPFQCPHCPSNFGYEAALYNHNKLVHMKNKQVKPTNPPSSSEPVQPWHVQLSAIPSTDNKPNS